MTSISIHADSTVSSLWNTSNNSTSTLSHAHFHSRNILCPAMCTYIDVKKEKVRNGKKRENSMNWTLDMKTNELWIIQVVKRMFTLTNQASVHIHSTLIFPDFPFANFFVVFYFIFFGTLTTLVSEVHLYSLCWVHLKFELFTETSLLRERATNVIKSANRDRRDMFYENSLPASTLSSQHWLSPEASEMKNE